MLNINDFVFEHIPDEESLFYAYDVCDFTERILRCHNCGGCEEGCAVCGLWFPYINETAEPQYKDASKIADMIIATGEDYILTV